MIINIWGKKSTLFMKKTRSFGVTILVAVVGLEKKIIMMFKMRVLYLCCYDSYTWLFSSRGSMSTQTTVNFFCDTLFVTCLVTSSQHHVMFCFWPIRQIGNNMLYGVCCVNLFHFLWNHQPQHGASKSHNIVFHI